MLGRNASRTRVSRLRDWSSRSISHPMQGRLCWGRHTRLRAGGRRTGEALEGRGAPHFDVARSRWSP